MRVALIPARGGSKGILRKNLRQIGSQSLLEIGIQKLKVAGVENIYVSTDDEEIKSVAVDLNAKPILRPTEISTDVASTESVINHFLEKTSFESNQMILVHQITSPFLTSHSINDAFQILESDESVNSVISIFLGHQFEWEVNTAGLCEPINHSRNYRPRRQELGLRGVETGGFYLFRKSAYLASASRFPEPTKYISVSRLEALDIDTPEDLEFAQQVVARNLQPIGAIHENR